MTVKAQAPGWGKAVGIVTICTSSFSVLYCLYKFWYPSMLRMQQQFMNGMSYGFEQTNDPVGRNFGRVFNDMFYLSKTAELMIYIFAGLGLVMAVLGIIAGSRMLKPRPENYNFCKNILIAAIALNVVQFIAMFSAGAGLVVMGMLTWNFIGAAADVAMLIIMLASNKAAYGIGEEPVFDRYNKGEEDEII